MDAANLVYTVDAEKDDVRRIMAEAGIEGAIRHNKALRSYELVTDGRDEAMVAKMRELAAPYMTPEAKLARETWLAGLEAAGKAAKAAAESIGNPDKTPALVVDAPVAVMVYTVAADKDVLRTSMSAAGIEGALGYNKTLHAYELMTGGRDEATVAKMREIAAPYMTPEAKLAREAWLVALDAARPEKVAKEAAQAIENKDKAPSLVDADAVKIPVYPAKSQRAEFMALVEQTGSKSGYDGHNRHYIVQTTTPEAFAGYVGEKAQERYKAEFEASNDGQVAKVVEVARQEAKGKNGGGFVNQAKDGGFLLAQSKNADRQQEQLDAMRCATTKQLEMIYLTTLIELRKMNQKEVELRAEASGLPAAQIKAMRYDEQRAVAPNAGHKGDDFFRAQQLARGLAAIKAELTDERNVAISTGKAKAVVNTVEAAVEKSVAPSVDKVEVVVPAPRPKAKAPTVDPVKDAEDVAAGTRRNTDRGR